MKNVARFQGSDNQILDRNGTQPMATEERYYLFTVVVITRRELAYRKTWAGVDDTWLVLPPLLTAIKFPVVDYYLPDMYGAAGDQLISRLSASVQHRPSVCAISVEEVSLHHSTVSLDGIRSSHFCLTPLIQCLDDDDGDIRQEEMDPAMWCQNFQKIAIKHPDISHSWTMRMMGKSVDISDWKEFRKFGKGRFECSVQ